MCEIVNLRLMVGLGEEGSMRINLLRSFGSYTSALVVNWEIQSFRHKVRSGY